MKKLLIILAVLLLVGCQAETVSEEVIEDVVEEIEPEPVVIPEEKEADIGEKAAEVPVIEAEPVTQEFEITAKRWEFSEDPIEVNKGDTVILKVRSIDIAHGIAIPDYDISERLSPGKEVEIEFVADKAGEFEFYCNVPCGSGHSGMRGTLIVK